MPCQEPGEANVSQKLAPSASLSLTTTPGSGPRIGPFYRWAHSTLLGEILSARDASLNQTDVPASRNDRYSCLRRSPGSLDGLGHPLCSVSHSLGAFQVSWGSLAASTAPLEGFRQPPILSRELSCSPSRTPGTVSLSLLRLEALPGLASAPSPLGLCFCHRQ